MAQTVSTRSGSKRKRVEETADSNENAATTPSDVWFKDGNVVLQAGGKAFKVHRGILSFHSTVFEGMFEIPQPSPEKETMVEGCPVVRLSDSALDVTIVLRALYQRGHVSTGEPISIAIVAAFLRLGKKYGLDMLRNDEALKRLYYEYPTTLTEFDAMNSYSMIEQNAWVDIDVTNVAREQGLLSVLPVALYICSAAMDAKALAAGIPRGDGTTARLLPNDIITCLVAYQSLAALQASTTFSWINPLLPHTDDFRACTNRHKCANVRIEVMRKLFVPSATIRGLCSWSQLQGEYNLNTMCPPCQKLAEEHHNEGRINFWDALPGVLGLPEWEELKKERD
ncbi:hypothetical protein FIBSPDRAFT_871365 [Athelia psychrophila]|uniref:BTB domain-containing protein n=1 Tax=Athelia psychrophila TaxID=1759441 RepID=A0A166ABR9_9AGAM|nr:hypothetical protein FIBSPDRAFT_871365 [Fibularhizoctonia sp. CBS 109695]